MRREDQTRDALPMSRDAERALQASRWIEHGAEDGGRNRPHPAGRNEARKLLEADQSGTGGISGALAGLPRNAGGSVMQGVRWMTTSNRTRKINPRMNPEP
jgi:hypothetical protein